MAIRAAVIALTDADRVAFDAGDLHQPADRVAGQPQVVLDTDLGRVLDLLRGAAEDLGEPRGRHGASRPDLTLAAHLGTGDGGTLLEQDPDRGGGEQESDHPVVVGAGDELACSSAGRRG